MAKYIILCNVQGAGYKISEDTPRPEDMYILIHLGADEEMDLNGKLHAYYGNQAMYVHDLTEDTYSNIPMTLYEKERTEK